MLVGIKKAREGVLIEIGREEREVEVAGTNL